MGMDTYAQGNRKITPQTEPIPGSAQVKNSAGGFSFQLDKWKKLERFLILGSEGGTYYIGEKDLTKEGTKNLESCIQDDGLRTVQMIAEISFDGRAVKNEPAIFALAMCLKKGNLATKAAARAAVQKVCRIGTHLFALAQAIESLGGWGRGTKKAFAKWYNEQTPDELALQLVKYQQRNGWSHKDVLRKSHVVPADKAHDALYRYALKGTEGLGKRSVSKWAAGNPTKKVTKLYDSLVKIVLPDMIDGFEKVKEAKTEKEVVKLIQEYNLPRETLPTNFLNSPEVWEALLHAGKHGMPMTAMLRNLGKMSEIGLLKPLSSASKFVAERLRDHEALKHARIHPLNVLIGMRTYSSGHGLRGSLAWNVVPQVKDALEDAFYGSFKFVEPSGKNFFLALDVSGSMGSPMTNLPITCAEASAAMAMVTARSEKNYFVHGFAGTFKDLGITAKDTIEQATKKAQDHNFGSTDCALPIEYAIQKKLDVHVFSVYTDSETYAGRRHSPQALKDYRQKTGIPAKMVVVGMTSNGFTIADPNDAGMLDVVGFDTTTPSVISDFSRE